MDVGFVTNAQTKINTKNRNLRDFWSFIRLQIIAHIKIIANTSKQIKIILFVNVRSGAPVMLTMMIFKVHISSDFPVYLLKIKSVAKKSRYINIKNIATTKYRLLPTNFKYSKEKTNNDMESKSDIER